MSYLSLSNRIPEIAAVESEAVTRFYGLITGLPLMRAAYRRFVAGALALGVKQGNCLDLGTGPGCVAVAIARSRPALRVVGLDLAAQMVEQARGQALRADLDGRGLWPQGDGHCLPFADGSFDLVVSSFALHHWQDAVRVLDEIARVLAPDGHYYIADVCREANLSQRFFAWGSIPFVSLPLGRYLGYGGYYESMRASYTRDEARILLARSALAPGEVETDLASWIPTLTIASKGRA
jgi:ubiquinone/menaquinone biosynthesis C-methylase UbiE